MHSPSALVLINLVFFKLVKYSCPIPLLYSIIYFSVLAGGPRYMESRKLHQCVKLSTKTNFWVTAM